MTDISIDTARERIEHVVVLMLENRSFDHLLGLLDHPNPAWHTLTPGDPDHANRDDPADPSSPSHPITDQAKTVLPLDPDHSHQAALLQLGIRPPGPPGSGYVASYRAKAGAALLAEAAAAATPYDLGALVMDLHRPESVPVLSRLAREFAIATRWFCSVPGETWPNRNFVHAATSDHAVMNEFGAYTDPTIFERLEAGDALVPPDRRRWRIYHDGPAQVMAFRKLWGPRRIRHWDPISAFAQHVADGDLAAYSFIEPNHSTPVVRRLNPLSSSQHPGNNRVEVAYFPDASPEDGADFLRAEQLIAGLYETLRAHPAIFERTLFVITHDENGGLWDSVETPSAVPPGDPMTKGFLRSVIGWFDRRDDAPDAPPSFAFDRLGGRVPAVLISPWIERAHLDARPRDHASVPRTLRELFVSSAPPLTDREQSSAPFWSVVSREEPRRGDDLPSLDDLVHPVQPTDAESGEDTTPLNAADQFTQVLVALARFVGDNLDLPEDETVGSAREYMEPVVAEGAGDQLVEEAADAMQRFHSRSQDEG